MKIQRLLLIPEMLWLFRLLMSLLLFCRMWLLSRSFSRLLLATPAIVLALTFTWALISSHVRNRDPDLLNHYRTLAKQAVDAGDVKAARLLFRRAQQLAPEDHNISMELALSLFHLGERAEAYQLLSSLAPVQKSGYLPAHRFLLENPPDLSQVQKDRFRVIHLSHLVRNAAETRQERMQLLQILAQYRKIDDAEKLIRAALDRYPEDLLFLAQLKAREGDQPGARQETEQACNALSAIVAKEPRNAERRIQLAQGLVFLARFADAICIVSEGMTSQSDDSAMSTNDSFEDGLKSVGQNDERPDRKLALALSSTYFAWMSTLQSDEQAMQLRCLAKMLDLNAPDSSATELPAYSSDQMQAALLAPETSWIRCALEGNARAALGQLSDAEDAYRLALQSAPNDPTLANNLAWVLLTKWQSNRTDSVPQDRQQYLTEALHWSERAVSAMPEIVSFLETRGQIQAALGNHALAFSDLTDCIHRGKDGPEIQRTLKACAQALR
jgi:tetratricopeptide (TPR) repeat protein